MNLSIIIPVYNVSGYIQRCLESILSQACKLIEIIIVDDCSRDKSIEIARFIVAKYSNAHVKILVHDKNGGLSAARNTGLRAAKGKYIWFIDSDDYIVDNCIKDLLDYLSVRDADIIQFDYICHKKEKEIRIERWDEYRTGNFTGIDCIVNGDNFTAWSNFYLKDFLDINHLSFTEGLLHEDGEFNMRAFTMANKVNYYKKILYNYDCTRDGSIMNTMNLNRPLSYLYYTDTFFSMIEDSIIKGDAIRVVSRIPFAAFQNAFSYASLLTKSDKKYFYNYIMEHKKKYVKLILLYPNRKYLFEILFVLFCPSLLSSLMSNLKK